MSKKKAIVSVINDLVTDQRVHKVSTTLHNMGFEVLLIGRKQKKSLNLNQRLYKTKRMVLLFEKGPLFYFEYQFRLFFVLLFNKSDVLVANDLDTLFPNYLISKIKNSHLVYDTHELFCEVPELQNSSFKRNIWKKLERFIFPKLKYVFTVNDSIANVYSKEYGIKVKTVRNVPMLNKSIAIKKSRKDLGLPEDKKIIILQGAGINIDRGAEEALEAMQYVNDAVLYIVGSGDVINILIEMTEKLSLQSKVFFTGKIPFEQLFQYTSNADLGLTLDKDTNINYRFSLPNKLFDYIHAGVPVLSSDLPEIKNIIQKYQVGDFILNHSPKHIADKINEIFAAAEKLNNWKKNTKIAAENLNWDIEEKELIQVYKKFLL